MRRLRIARFAVVIVMCIFLVACGKDKKPGENKDRPAEPSGHSAALFPYDGATYTEKYVLFQRGGANGIWFFDTETKQSARYCFDPTCEHKRPVYDDFSGKKLEDGCISLEICETPYLYGDHLYYYEQSPLRFYRADRQGNERELFIEPEKPYGGINWVYYTDEALYLGYTVQYEYTAVETGNGTKEWRVGELREKPETGVLRLPYSGGKEEVIFRSDEYYSMMITEFQYYDGKLRFLVYGEDRPHVNLDMSDPDFQEKMAENHQHIVTEAYEYAIATGEVKKIFRYQPYTVTYFFDESYGMLDGSERLILYRYDGEKVAESEVAPMDVVYSDHGIIGMDKTTHEYFLLDEKSGNELKRSTITYDDMTLFAVVGDSFYGFIQNSNSRAYISADDFWSGNKGGIVIFPDESKVGISVDPSVTPKSEPAADPTVTPKQFTVSVENPPYPTTKQVTWADWCFFGIPKQNRKEINRLLYEKGLDCQIRFVFTEESGQDYEDWVREYEKQYGPPDIITTGIWSAEEVWTGKNDRFVKDNILPFNEQLETDAWKTVKELFTEDEWKQVTSDGNVYGIPYTVYGTPEYHGLDTAVYVAVNEDYDGFFESFDGTYGSLMKIYREIGDEKLAVAINGIGEERVLYGLLGYDTFMELAYQRETHTVKDLSGTDELKDLLREIHRDLKSGVLIRRDSEAVPIEIEKERILAYIHGSKQKPIEGFRDYLIARDMYSSGCGLYGVSLHSEQKETAFEILAACYSDPEIRSLMTEIDDRELIDQRVALLSGNPKSELAGFRAILTEEQAKKLGSSDGLALVKLLNAMYSVTGYDPSGNAKRELKQTYDIDAAWEVYVEAKQGLDDIYATVNSQIKDWLDDASGE